MTLTVKDLLNYQTVDTKTFIPIIQLCGDALLTSYDNIAITIKKSEYIRDSMEHCVYIQFEHQLLTSTTYNCFFKVYWNYDMEILYTEKMEVEKPSIFLKKYHVKNMMQSCANLITWGFVDNLHEMFLKKSH